MPPDPLADPLARAVFHERVRAARIAFWIHMVMMALW
jgi:hypothetical protein